MNFRDICQLAVKEAGVKDGGPSTVIGQSGILGLFVTWVQQAWVELWYEQEWKFRWKRATTTLTAGTAEYATLPGLSDVDRVFAYEIWNASVTPKQRLRYVDHSVIDQAEVMSIRWPTSRKPNGSFVFYPTPAADTQVRLDYLMSVTALAGTPTSQQYQRPTCTRSSPTRR